MSCTARNYTFYVDARSTLLFATRVGPENTPRENFRSSLNNIHPDEGNTAVRRFLQKQARKRREATENLINSLIP